MKRIVILAAVVLMAAGSKLLAQTPIYDTGRVYDVVTMHDTFYLRPPFTPCFNPVQFNGGPALSMLKEYVTSTPVTVYGVAFTVKNRFDDYPFCDNLKDITALLTKCLGTSPINNYAKSMQIVDTVTFNRAHPRFCWYLYEDPCDSCDEDKEELQSPCYELYFDTPHHIDNIVTDTFYVGRHYPSSIDPSRWPLFAPREIGGAYDPSLPSNTYGSAGYTGDDLDGFFYYSGSMGTRWGVAFPIIGFRCKPILFYQLVSYTGASAVLRWLRVEEGTLYNVRLVGEDGSDTTFVTADTTITLSNLSDSVRYNVRLRKQCHYATSNYDTTVYSRWLDYISFGVTIHPDTTGGGGDSVGIAAPVDEGFVLSPNPAQGSVQVQLPPTALGGQLSLCDLAGREVIVRAVTGTSMELDISRLPAGAYLVKLATPDGVSTRRLLVE